MNDRASNFGRKFGRPQSVLPASTDVMRAVHQEVVRAAAASALRGMSMRDAFLIAVATHNAVPDSHAPRTALSVVLLDSVRPSFAQLWYWQLGPGRAWLPKTRRRSPVGRATTDLRIALLDQRHR